MHFVPLLLFSHAYSSVASSLSAESQSVHKDLHSAEVAAEIEHDVESSPGIRLPERDTAPLAYNALGLFGDNGLLGSINAEGESVQTNGAGDMPPETFEPVPFVCIGLRGCPGSALAYYVTRLADLGLEEAVKFFRGLTSFHNADTAQWPTTGVGLWSIRTFRTQQCGKPGLRLGLDVYSGDNDGPWMMSEYHSTDFHYHDHRPCENFMFKAPLSNDNVKVQSVAVWLDSSVTDGIIALYSSPVCDVTVIDNQTFSKFERSDVSNLVFLYNGTAAHWEGDEEDPTVEAGVWACINPGNMVWNAFSVVRIGETKMTIPDGYYQNGHIPASQVQPKNPAYNNTYGPWAAIDWRGVGPAPQNSLNEYSISGSETW